MLCVECGETLNEGARFCPKCGGKQPEVETNVDEGATASGNDGERTNGSATFPTSVIPNRVERTIEAKSAVSSLNGKYIALLVGKELQIMDANTGEIVRSSEWMDWEGVGAVGSDGIHVGVSVQEKNQSGSNETKRYILNLARQKNIHSDGWVGPIAFSADCKKYAIKLKSTALTSFLSGSRKGSATSRVVSLPENEELFAIGEKIEAAFQFSSDGRYLSGKANEWLCILNAHTGEKLYGLKGGNRMRFYPFSIDGSRFLTTHGNTRIKVWQSQDTEPTEYKEHLLPPGYTCACFSTDDKAIVIGYENGYMRIINSETGKLLRELWHNDSTKSVEWVSYSSNGQNLISYTDGKLNFWVQANSIEPAELDPGDKQEEAAIP